VDIEDGNTNAITISRDGQATLAARPTDIQARHAPGAPPDAASDLSISSGKTPHPDVGHLSTSGLPTAAPQGSRVDTFTDLLGPMQLVRCMQPGYGFGAILWADKTRGQGDRSSIETRNGDHCRDDKTTLR
jgi:hypothetical protein